MWGLGTDDLSDSSDLKDLSKSIDLNNSSDLSDSCDKLAKTQLLGVNLSLKLFETLESKVPKLHINNNYLKWKLIMHSVINSLDHCWKCKTLFYKIVRFMIYRFVKKFQR